MLEPCKLFPGWLDARGYGTIYSNGKKRRAHRIAYEEHIGPIAEGLYVLHHCDVRDCIEPTHLYVGTQADNMKDMVSRKRSHHPIGIVNGRAKLTDKIAMEIFNRKDLNGVALAKEYGVSHVMIYKIKAKKAWKHIHYL